MSEPKADGIRRVFMEIGEQPKRTKDIMTQTARPVKPTLSRRIELSVSFRS